MTKAKEQELRQQLDNALKANNMNLASSCLDDLLRHFVKTRQFDTMTNTLEEIVKDHGDEWSFRWRLASLYERLGKIDAAVKHLDVLSEQMLNAEDEDGAAMVTDKLRQLRGD